MSKTFDFVCDECKEKVWAHQSNHTQLYSYPEIMDFLIEHEGHKIRFVDNCNDVQSEYYDEIEHTEIKGENK